MAIWIVVGIGFAAIAAWALWGWPPFVNTLDPQSLIDSDVSGFQPGCTRQSDGTVVVRAITPMPGVSAEMVRWWFADYMQTTEHYKRWHPQDHVWMDWADKTPGEIVGASHLVHEYIGGELDKLRITFTDPARMYGTDPNEPGRFVICAKPGLLKEPTRIGVMSHVVCDTDDGAEMRSCFWLGRVDSEDANSIKRTLTRLIGNTNLARRFMVKDAKAAGLQQHCTEEMSTLAGFLPELYAQRKE